MFAGEDGASWLSFLNLFCTLRSMSSQHLKPRCHRAADAPDLYRFSGRIDGLHASELLRLADIGIAIARRR